MTNLQWLTFEGQDLCAPRNKEFQVWLSGIPNAWGPTCAHIFFAEEIPDLKFTRDVPVAAIVLPKADGGNAPYAYTLRPALPAGLVFDDSTLTISGIPGEPAARIVYSYTATDAEGLEGSLTFTVEVASAVAFVDAIADQSFLR